jgi:uncharacterized repeat protein (TIGR02543 family)
MKHKILLTSLIAMFAVGSVFADTTYVTNGSTCNEGTLGTSVLNNGTADLVADWSLNTFNIDYHTDGGWCSGGDAINDNCSPTSYDVEHPVTSLPTPEKTGYDFVNWYDAQSSGNVVTQLNDTNVPTGNANGSTKDLYARWSAHTYNITYKCNNTTVATTQATYNAATPAASILHAQTTCTDYISGSGDDFTCSTALPAAGATWQIASDVVCEYTTSGKNIDVRWYANETDVTPYADNDCSYGLPTVVLPTQPEKMGYTFKGWKIKTNN